MFHVDYSRNNVVSGVILSFLLCAHLCTPTANINIGWMAPNISSLDPTFPYNASTSVGALALALDTMETFLPHYNISVSYLDSGCNSKQSLGVLVDFLFRHQVDVVFGPPCSEGVQSVGELLAYREIPFFNWVSTGQGLVWKSRLTTYVRSMAPVSSLGGIMYSFFYYTQWKRLVILSSDGVEYSAVARAVAETFRSLSFLDIEVVHHYSDLDDNSTVERIDAVFNSVKYEARVLIMVFPKSELRKYMLRADVLGMTSGDYQFLFCDAEFAGHNDIAYVTSDAVWRVGDENDSASKQAFQNVLYFLLGHDGVNVSAWSRDAQEAYSRRFGNRTDMPSFNQPDEFSAYLHDAVVLYARTVNSCNCLPYEGLDIQLSTYYQFFKGLSGDVVMSYFGDRQPSFFVYDLNTEGRFHLVASLKYEILNDTYTIASTYEPIIWGDGRTSDDYIPSDIPQCGFLNENCRITAEKENDVTILVVAVVSSTMMIILLILFFIFRWWRSEMELRNMSWMIPFKELNFALGKRARSLLNVSSRLGQSRLSMNIVHNKVRGGADGGSRGGCSSSVGGETTMTAKGQVFTTVALYKGDVVAVKKVQKKKLNLHRKLLVEIKTMMTLKHGNLSCLLGICTEVDNIYAVWEYCTKGSLQDVLQNDDIKLDKMFKLSFLTDICKGIEYLHKSDLGCHGNLKSSNCVIDSRWVCKLTDYGLYHVKLGQEVGTVGDHAQFAALFWTAPELLRKMLKKEVSVGTAAADIYALGVIIKELVTRSEPYDCPFSPEEIVQKVAYRKDEDVFRPCLAGDDCELLEQHGGALKNAIERCWSDKWEDRPSIKSVIKTVHKINPNKKASVVDNMIAMMEKYSSNLEELVTDRTQQLEEEKRKTDALLYRMLPKKIAEDLKIGRPVQAESFGAVTIYFSDIVQFTDLARESTPMQIVALLNSLYTLFDDIISHYDVYKVETIGDAYMIVSGLPVPNGNQHVKEIASAAVHILNDVLTFQIPHKPDQRLQIRIGLHTGPVVAGVVGLTMPRYCLFGDTVNTASRMESNGKPLSIHISSATQQALSAFPEFSVHLRGDIPVKGKGTMRTYWITGGCTEDSNITADSGLQSEYDTVRDESKFLNAINDGISKQSTKNTNAILAKGIPTPYTTESDINSSTTKQGKGIIVGKLDCIDEPEVEPIIGHTTVGDCSDERCENSGLDENCHGEFGPDENCSQYSTCSGTLSTLSSPVQVSTPSGTAVDTRMFREDSGFPLEKKDDINRENIDGLVDGNCVMTNLLNKGRTRTTTFYIASHDTVDC